MALHPACRDPTVLRQALEPPGSPVVLLVDDVHVLAESPEALEELARAVAREPRGWVLSGRWIPSRLLEGLPPSESQTGLTEADLAFSPEEIAHLLGLDLPNAARLHARTRGWPIVIALLAQPDAGRPLPERWPEVRERLFDELARSVLHRLPEPLRTFLFRTALPLFFRMDLAGVLLSDRPDLQAQIPRLAPAVPRAGGPARPLALPRIVPGVPDPAVP